MLTIRKNVATGDDGIFHGDTRFDTVTVTVLLVGARNETDRWYKAFRRHEWPTLGRGATVADYWQATLNALLLTATVADREGDYVTYAVRGPVPSLTFLTDIDYFPLQPTRTLGGPMRNRYARFAQNTAKVPRGGRPADYERVGELDGATQTIYAPVPHGRPAPKRPAKHKRGKGTVGDATAVVPVVPSVNDIGYDPQTGAWYETPSTPEVMRDERERNARADEYRARRP